MDDKLLKCFDLNIGKRYLFSGELLRYNKQFIFIRIEKEFNPKKKFFYKLTFIDKTNSTYMIQREALDYMKLHGIFKMLIDNCQYKTRQLAISLANEL